jgi:hypothetical protein
MDLSQEKAPALSQLSDDGGEYSHKPLRGRSVAGYGSVTAIAVGTVTAISADATAISADTTAISAAA